jgi:hypothetical protein
MNRLLDFGLEQLTTLVFKMGEVAKKAIITSVRGFITEDTTKRVFQILGEMSADLKPTFNSSSSINLSPPTFYHKFLHKDSL